MTYEKRRDEIDAKEEELGYKIHEWNEIYAKPAHRNRIKKERGLLVQNTNIHDVIDVRIYDDMLAGKDRYVPNDVDIHTRTIRTFFINSGQFDDNDKPTKFISYGSGFKTNRVWYTDLKLFRNKPFK